MVRVRGRPYFRPSAPGPNRILVIALLAILLTILPSLGASEKCRRPSATTPASDPTSSDVTSTSSRLPLPFSKSRPPATIHLFDFVNRYRTSRPNSLVLKFKKRDVSLESGARFLFSPTWFPTEEMTFSYAFKVKKGFNFVLSGKLPGVYFGTCRDCYSTGKVYKDGQGSFRPTWQVEGNGKTGTAYIEPYVYGAHGTVVSFGDDEDDTKPNLTPAKTYLQAATRPVGTPRGQTRQPPSAPAAPGPGFTSGRGRTPRSTSGGASGTQSASTSR